MKKHIITLQRSRAFRRIGLLLVLLLWTLNASAANWSIHYPRPINESDSRYEYPLTLLKLALSKTGVRYTLTPSERILLQGKAIRQLKENREINIVWVMTDMQREAYNPDVK